MDERHMIAPFLHDLPAWSIALILLAHVGAGLAMGVLYFHGVWWNVGLLTGRRRPIFGIVVALWRFGILGVLLWLVSNEGAAPLLATAAGIVAARAVVVRRLGTAP
jgi:F1F0 ATPase subunit 2